MLAGTSSVGLALCCRRPSVMADLQKIKAAIASTLHSQVKSYNIPSVATTLGLAAGDEQEAFANKRAYIVKRLSDYTMDKLITIAKTVQETYPTESLQCVIEEFDPG